jgi:uncharacterized protein YqjF (DUF2071 family)
MNAAFLTAEWRRLVMLSFAIEPQVLRLYTPRGTEIDEWRGATYVTLVGFLFLNTKVKGIAIPFHRDFEEINLRFYVRSRGPEGWRRGVVFIREVVPRRTIASVARWLYNENYVACPTRSTTRDPSGTTPGRAEYNWNHEGHWLTIGADYAGASSHPAEGSQEEFITEHYWGYAIQRDGGSVEYRVEHPQWRVWPATQATLDGDLTGFYGPEFASALTRSPSSAFVADGSPVIVRNGNRINDDAGRITSACI